VARNTRRKARAVFLSYSFGACPRNYTGNVAGPAQPEEIPISRGGVIRTGRRGAFKDSGDGRIFLYHVELHRRDHRSPGRRRRGRAFSILGSPEAASRSALYCILL